MNCQKMQRLWDEWVAKQGSEFLSRTASEPLETRIKFAFYEGMRQAEAYAKSSAAMAAHIKVGKLFDD